MKVYQANQSKAELHFDIGTDGLLYKRNLDGINTADVKVSVLSRSMGQAINTLDTLSFSISDQSASSKQRSLAGYSMIPLVDTISYKMTVRVLDVNRGLEVVHELFLFTENRDRYSKLTSPDGVMDGFTVLRSDSAHRLDSYELNGYELSVESYTDDFPLPLPPFSLDTPTPYRGKKDEKPSVYKEEDGSYMVSCPEGRICRFSDIVAGKSISLRQVSSSFPVAQDIDDLIQVLRYISTKQEYDAMRYADDKREAFEDFWLECAGSKDRAKSLINELYSRVKEADASFSSHVDGWRTDRGVVHIIYGTPSTIVKDVDKEIWFYGNDNELSNLRMTFRRTTNPFSDNDFRLERTLAYKSSWYTAVDAWRNGRIVDF